MPAKSTSPLGKGEGPAIQMDYLDHTATSSYGSGKLPDAYRAHVQSLINQKNMRGAMETEIQDVRGAAGLVSDDVLKYNRAIKEILIYARFIKLI